MKHIIVLFIALMVCLCLNAEVRIQMEKEAGVYKVPCQVNGLKMKFIFDTGAANVSMSSTYAEMMLENGYLVESDFKGTMQSILADGSVVDNVVVNLRNVEIAGKTIENVTALVVASQNAPLLLGQSVIQRLGKVSIDGDYLVIHNANIYTETEIEAIYKKAEDFFEHKVYSEALKNYQTVYDYWGDNVNPWVLYSMGICYSNLKDNDSSEKCHLKAIELDGGENEDGILCEVYAKLSSKANDKCDYNRSLEYSILMQKYAIDRTEKAMAFERTAYACYKLKKYSDAISYSDKAIESYKLASNNRKLDSYYADNYVFTFLDKGWSLESLHRYDDAIDAFTTGKRILEKYNNENFYQIYMDAFNSGLSRSYKELTTH